MPEFEEITCCNCAMVFFMPQDFQRRRRDDGAWFYCPAGHKQHYSESQIDKLKRQIDEKDKENNRLSTRVFQEKNRADGKQRSLNTVRGHLTRTKNKIQRGNCPCCETHFPDLQKHIRDNHPGYTEELKREIAAEEKSDAGGKKKVA